MKRTDATETENESNPDYSSNMDECHGSLEQQLRKLKHTVELKESTEGVTSTCYCAC